jgi:hypothetical protein
MAARAEFQLGIGIGGVVVDDLGERALHQIGDAGDHTMRLGTPPTGW